jgi:hypothetical protein
MPAPAGSLDISLKTTTAIGKTKFNTVNLILNHGKVVSKR